MASLGYFNNGAGADLDVAFCGRGRIKVERKGRYHPVYTLRLNGQNIAELCWRGPRRAQYATIKGDEKVGKLDLKIGPMKRKIRAVDDDGRLSKLMISSNRNLTRRDLRLHMFDGDNFIVRRRLVDRWGASRFEIHKQHYLNNL